MGEQNDELNPWTTTPTLPRTGEARRECCGRTRFNKTHRALVWDEFKANASRLKS